MSGEKDPYPSSPQFAELQKLQHEAPGKKRSSRAWRLLGQAYGNDDLPVLLDFALEQGLVNSCEAAWQKAQKDRPSRCVSWVNPADGSEMIWIPAGPFFVGPRQRKEQAQSKGFALARHPVTNAQFAKFLQETDYTPPPEHPAPELFLSHWRGGSRFPIKLNEIPKKLMDHPVVWVSYIDALTYCDWAGLTLPTEWLWEKAARGPEGPPYPWGDLPPRNANPRLANVRSTAACPVGSFPRTRTAYGCEDMVGNVSEWCRMIKGDDHGLLPEDRPPIRFPKGRKLEFAAVRGACFLRSGRLAMPAWHRRRLSVIRRNRWVGFRPACFLPCYPA
jgi:serine/threonine-protein kinase